MPWPISAGVFGIARTTRSLPVACAIASLRMPAITLRCRASATNGARRRGGAAKRLRLDRPDDERGVTKRRVGGGQHPHAEVARQALALRRVPDRRRRSWPARGRRATARRRSRWPCCRPRRMRWYSWSQCTQRARARHHRMRFHSRPRPCTSKAPAIAAPCASASKRTAPCRSCTATARSAARRRAAAATRSTSAAPRRR